MSGLIICTLVAIFMVYCYFNAMNLTKRLEVAPEIVATVISCESFKDKDNDDREITYYHITYEYNYNGITYNYIWSSGIIRFTLFVLQPYLNKIKPTFKEDAKHAELKDRLEKKI